MKTSEDWYATQLDSLVAGGMDAEEARPLVRKILKENFAEVDFVYEALRNVTWRIISSRTIPDDVAQWNALQSHCAAVSKQRKRIDLEARFLTLSDMLVQTVRFFDRQPVADLFERLHVDTILTALIAHKGSVKRSLLSQVTGLGDANLSRVLSILEAHDVITRRRSGKEALIFITDSGATLLRNHSADKSDGSDEIEFRIFERSPVPHVCWSADGVMRFHNPAFSYFMERAGCREAAEKGRSDLDKWMIKYYRHGLPSNDESDTDLNLGKEGWFRCKSWSVGDLEAMVLINISDLKKTERDFQWQLKKSAPVKSVTRTSELAAPQLKKPTGFKGSYSRRMGRRNTQKATA